MDFQEFKENLQKTPVQEVAFHSPKNPVVSVLVQTYQQQDFIRECLDSILMQETTFDFEILIGEDGSMDGTREICVEYTEKYPEKIRLFLHHRENQIKILGESTSNFNAFYNFYSARGTYIAFCEGDDLWGDPLKLEKQVAFLKNQPNYVFAYHSFRTINEKGSSIESVEELFQPKWDISQQDLLKGKYHPLIFTLCFRNVFSEIPEEMPKVLNVDTFLLSYLGKFGEGKFLPGINPGFYRKHSGGMWSQRQKEKKFLSKVNTFKNLRNYYKKEPNKEIINFYTQQIINTSKMLIWFYLKSGEIKKSWVTFLASKRVAFLF